MFGKRLVIVVAVTLLLATLASPALAASADTNGLTRLQTTTWSVPVYSLPGVVPGHFRLMCGGCSPGGNCSC